MVAIVDKMIRYEMSDRDRCLYSTFVSKKQWKTITLHANMAHFNKSYKASITHLTRSLDSLESPPHSEVRPSLAKVAEGVSGGVEESGLNQPDAHQGAGASLAALAVHHRNVERRAT